MSAKLLLKILIAAAWIDGEIQPQESEYLKKIAIDQNLAEDPEIKNFFSTTRAVELIQGDCHRWVKEYLGAHPTPEDYRNLVSQVGGLIYSDGDVGVREADLLNSLEKLDPSDSSFSDKFLKMLGRFGKA